MLLLLSVTTTTTTLLLLLSFFTVTNVTALLNLVLVKKKLLLLVLLGLLENLDFFFFRVGLFMIYNYTSLTSHLDIIHVVKFIAPFIDEIKSNKVIIKLNTLTSAVIWKNLLLHVCMYGQFKAGCVFACLCCKAA